MLISNKTSFGTKFYYQVVLKFKILHFSTIYCQLYKLHEKVHGPWCHLGKDL
jgi:hypothetical protein